MTDTRHAPVTDWAEDFDHTDPTWAANPFPIWDEIRASSCPVAHTTRYGGAWLPLTHELVTEVAYDTDHFSSRSVIVNDSRPGAIAPVGVAPPISSDPPFHHGARRLLLPEFTPKAIAPLEDFTRTYCSGLLDAVASRDVVDAAIDYGQHIPVRVIAKMLGFPPEDADRFRKFVYDALERVDRPPAERAETIGDLVGYISDQMVDHDANPRDDLTSFLLEAEMDGERISRQHVFGTIALLLLAGIDTTWSAIGASIWHLARNPGDRARLVEHPELIPSAIEEFLRAYAPVTMARLVKDDFDFHGCPMKADDWVLLSFPSANRDPRAFDSPDDVIIDRAENRHAAFGLGIHRCLGSNLARLELRVAIETWLERYPDFTIADEAAVRWSGGQVRGPRVLPIRVLDG
ncbi:MAG: cytochrome P450 [Actinobacteria bacterium]|nr:cytochrome P450 [Actinomycetota bacterium]